MKKISYIPETCQDCGQTCTYILAISPGTVDMLKSIALVIETKGINIVHPRKEMEGTHLTSNQINNMSSLHYHGLVARCKDKPGNYCLTKKGMVFLDGGVIPQYVIVSKKESRTIEYFEPEKYSCTIGQFKSKREKYWQGIGFEIREGKVFHRI